MEAFIKTAGVQMGGTAWPCLVTALIVRDVNCCTWLVPCISQIVLSADWLIANSHGATWGENGYLVIFETFVL